jgi:carbamoyltransferase
MVTKQKMEKNKMVKPVWIAGIARGHNSGVCLLKNGEIVFSIEEERLSRHKYDGGPYASMIKILEYTDKLDYLVIAHTQSLNDTAGRVDFTGDNVYTGLARKLGLIDQKADIYNHPQVIDLSNVHHKLHAACAFYKSGWDEAAALIVDGAGTFINMSTDNETITTWEVESIFKASYPCEISTIYKHYATKTPLPGAVLHNFSSDIFNEPNQTHEAVFSDRAGITKVYEAVTQYCGWAPIEAGKTMGLFPYGKPNSNIPKLFNTTSKVNLSNRDLVIPNYPNGAFINKNLFTELEDCDDDLPGIDITTKQNRRDLAYAVQTQTQEQVLALIKKAAEMTGLNKVVISGGYALNCVANYWYLDQLKDTDIEIYIEPISNDAGTAMGAALMMHYMTTQSTEKLNMSSLYLGPAYTYTKSDIENIANKYSATVEDTDVNKIVKLLTEKNIVTIFQGRSENGPRALGNRSVLFDPRFEDGKDFVNLVKHREYFRPFAGTILQECADEWFDMRGLKSSPHMMYAVNCKPGYAEKIPSIIHVDGTCRIQTVTQSQNFWYRNLIETFYDETGVPILFNTSFNLGGEPLVETLEDALWTLKNSDIEYLYLPEYDKLITLKN